jgi:hypothetical protein
MRTAATVLRLNKVTGEPRETETLMRGSERGRQKSTSTQLITRWRPTLPYGHGVLVVVWGGESPLRGEGGQVDDMGKGEGCEMHKNLNLSICRQLES